MPQLFRPIRWKAINVPGGDVPQARQSYSLFWGARKEAGRDYDQDRIDQYNNRLF